MQQPPSRFYWTEAQHSLLNSAQHIKIREPHKEILSLKSSDLCQTSNFTKGYPDPSALFRYCLRFSPVHWCYSDKTDFITLILRKTEASPRYKIRQQTNTKKQKTKITTTIKTKEIIPCLIFSWKILSSLIVHRWHEEVKLASLWCHVITSLSFVQGIIQINEFKRHILLLPFNFDRYAIFGKYIFVLFPPNQSRTLTFQTKLSYLCQWKPFKNDEKCFLFIVKTLFV